jgi:hypothetical protein
MASGGRLARIAEVGRRTKALGRWLAACALALAVAAPASFAQGEGADAPLPSFAELEAAGAIIGEIRIVTGDVFDTDDPREDNALFRAANRLHIETRPWVIRRSLLFRSGEPVRVHAIEETERLLRGARYLYEVHIRPLAYRDGVVDLEVVTRDTWTLYPTITLSRAGGVTRTEFGVSELNLLGTGSELSISSFRDVDRSGKALDFANDHALGPWTSLRLSVAENSDGSKLSLALVRPFFELDARRSAGVYAIDNDRVDSVYNAGVRVGEYRHRSRVLDVFGGWSPGLVDGWVRRYTLGLRLRDHEFAPEPGRPAPRHLLPDETLIGPYLRFDLIEDRFERTENRQQIGRPEYFALGVNASVQIGWAAQRLGSTDDTLLYRAALARGFELDAQQRLLAAARIDGQVRGGRIRRQQIGAEFEYFLPHHRRRLFYASLAADVLTDPEPADFLYLGGEEGLRGYPLRYQAGTRRVLLTLEERLYTGAFPWRLFRIGAAAFVDVGRAWGGTNPNLINPGWLVNVGLGLRLFSVRTAFGNVAHLDVALPLQPAGDVEGVQVLLRARRTF